MSIEKEKMSIDDDLEKRESCLEGVATTISSPEDAQKARRKIDFILLPCLAFCYFLQFLDKQSLSYSSILGLTADLGLVGKQFSWTASIFYFGYIGASYPCAYLSVRLPIGIYLSSTVLLWAVALMCHAAATNYGSLLATRFFLGVFEAGVAPGFALLTPMYYTRREQPLRFGIWFCGNGVASLFGGLFAYGIGHLGGALHPWQYLFLIFGAITAGFAAIMVCIVPDGPTKAWWLSPAERIAAVERLRDDSTGAVKSTFKKYQVWEAIRDPCTWFLFLYVFCTNIANGGLTSFGSLVIKGFGYEGLQALLIQMPTGAAQLGFIVVGCLTATYVKNVRTVAMIILTCISLLGMCLMYALPFEDQAGRLGGFCLSLAFAANMPLSLSLVASNVGGFTKRAVVNATVLMGYCVGNIVGPQFFSVDEAPSYPSGIKACLSGFCLGVFWLVCMLLYLIWTNKRREANPDIDLDAPISKEDMMADKTDWEIPRRYVL